MTLQQHAGNFRLILKRKLNCVIGIIKYKIINYLFNKPVLGRLCEILFLLNFKE